MATTDTCRKWEDSCHHGRRTWRTRCFVTSNSELLRWWTRTLLRLIVLVAMANRQSMARTVNETSTVTTIVDVAGSNREWFAIALCRATCLDISGILRRTQGQEEMTPPPTPSVALPDCVMDTRDKCGPAINLTNNLSNQKVTCSSEEGSSAPCGGTVREPVADYDKCVQLCQNPEVQKSCLSPCSSHQFLLSNVDLNETSQQSWVTAIVPMSPRPPCQPKKAVRQPIVDEEETADDESSVENQEISTDDEEEEEDCDFEGGVMVKEVWDTKGATLKWAMAPVQHCPPLIDDLLLSQNHQLVVYIVQMRQLLRLQPNMVADEWKTITATTHTTTNLKYVLTLGLHYQVRVIAMSARGICSATQESRPFGLPKGHPSPGPPRNLRYADYNRAGGGVLGNTIHWDPPSFSIPISHYLITWFVHDSHRRHNQHQSSETLQAHTSRLRHHLHASRHPPLHPHVVVPGKRRTYRIRNLLNGHIYTVQIQAVARLGDTDIYGEPAALKIHTFNLTTTRSSVQVSESTTTTTPPSTTNPSRFNANIINLNISRIFFENGILQAKIQWNYTQDANHEVKQFFIRVHSPLCRDIFQLDHSPRGEHERHYYAPFSETSHLILDLRFDCIYQVGVVAVSERGLHGSETAITIETPHCHQVQVQGDIGPDCPPSAPHHFWCNMDRQTRVMAATCHWTYRHIHSNSTTFRGFHIVANTHQSPHRHGGPLKNTSTQMFVNKDARQVVLTELVPNNKYHVTIRVVGENGYGPNAHAHFFASSPPFYHGSHHPVTYQAWQTNGSKSGHLINNLICLVLLTLISTILQKSRYRL